MLLYSSVALGAALLASSFADARSVASASKRANSLVVSPNVMTLSRPVSKKVNSRSAAVVFGKSRAVAAAAAIANTTTTSVLTSLFIGEEFATPIEFGTKTFSVIVDTGSSDTWLVESTFGCIDLDSGDSTTQAACAFGPLLTVDSSFVKTSGEEFSIEYGDGEYLTGVIGTETVTLAGITVPKQTVALVTSAAWNGDGTTSGLVGLAYSGITSAYKTSTGAQVLYSPIIQTMIANGLTGGLFSMAIERDISGPAGYLALGGLPPLAYTGALVSTPIVKTTISGYPSGYDFYAINLAGIYLKGVALAIKSIGATTEYIVDSGTTLNYFPTTIANAINAAFVPAAKYSDDEGAYIVSCTAVAPSLSIDIAGTLFTINPLDMILDAGDGTCITGIDDGGSSLTADVFILGDTFMKNAIVVFDVTTSTMMFGARENYTSNDTV